MANPSTCECAWLQKQCLPAVLATVVLTLTCTHSAQHTTHNTMHNAHNTYNTHNTQTHSVSTEDYVPEMSSLCAAMLKDYMFPTGMYAAGSSKVLASGAVQT